MTKHKPAPDEHPIDRILSAYRPVTNHSDNMRHIGAKAALIAYCKGVEAKAGREAERNILSDLNEDVPPNADAVWVLAWVHRKAEALQVRTAPEDSGEPETKFKFGDLLENGWAGDKNPNKVSMFLRYSKHNIVAVSIKDGEVLRFLKDSHKMKVIGSMLPQATQTLTAEDKRKSEPSAPQAQGSGDEVDKVLARLEIRAIAEGPINGLDAIHAEAKAGIELLLLEAKLEETNFIPQELRTIIDDLTDENFTDDFIDGYRSAVRDAELSQKDRIAYLQSNLQQKDGEATS